MHELDVRFQGLAEQQKIQEAKSEKEKQTAIASARKLGAVAGAVDWADAAPAEMKKLMAQRKARGR